MKTLKNTKTGEIKRVDDKTANNLTLPSVSYLNWIYCPKSEWKSNKKSIKEETTVSNKSEKQSQDGQEKDMSKRRGNSKSTKR
jgi:hypothetical protein